MISAPGFEIVHTTLHRPVPHRHEFDVIERHLSSEGRPRAALCATELRSPCPFSVGGFNAGYVRILGAWGLFVGGLNPVSRTNVAPEVDPPDEPVLYGFSYARPSDPSLPPIVVVARAGELPEGVLATEGIVRAGDFSPEGIIAKATFVMDLIEHRLHGLAGDWPAVTAIDIDTVHPVGRLLPEVILRPAKVAGARRPRVYGRPPIVGIEYEMDLRGNRTELWIG